jgi:creatinine amidohydrolase/Fe(II)-dependent formamide hydrolase-like protein
VGNPGESSPELGERLLETAGEKLAALLQTVDEREWPQES